MTEDRVNKMAQEIWVAASTTAQGIDKITKDERKMLLKRAVEIVFEFAEAFAEVEEERKNK